MQFPLITIFGSIVRNPSSSIGLTLPMLELVGEGGGRFEYRIPFFTAVIEAHIDPVAAINVTLPRLTLSAIAITTGSGIASVSIPILSVSASASLGPYSIFDKQLPMWLLSATAIAGSASFLEKSYPSLKLSASAYWLTDATLDKSLPPWELTAFARTINVGLCFNPRNMAFSDYVSFDYKGITYFNGKSVAITRTGLHELSGDMDNGLPIEWKMRSGKIDLAHNHLRQAWITGKFGGDFTVAIEDIDGNRYEYEAVPWSENANEARVKFGKNIRTRYAVFELSGDHAAEIDRIRFFGVRGGMKR